MNSPDLESLPTLWVLLLIFITSFQFVLAAIPNFCNLLCGDCISTPSAAKSKHGRKDDLDKKSGNENEYRYPILMTGHFHARIANASELCQMDRGELAPRDQQTKFCASVPIRCASDDDAIDITITLYVEVDITRLGTVGDAPRLAAVVFAGAKEVIPRLAKYAPWKLYDLERCELSQRKMLTAAAEEYELRHDEKLAEAVIQQLIQATKFHREVATGFEKAKKHLEENLDWLREHPSQARKAASFIAECMRSDAAPSMGMWNREKASRLEDEVSDLIRRKNSNHSGYRHAADSISSILYTIHSPTAWAKYPPSPTLLNGFERFGVVQIFRPSYKVECSIRERARHHLFSRFSPGDTVEQRPRTKSFNINFSYMRACYVHGSALIKLTVIVRH